MTEDGQAPEDRASGTGPTADGRFIQVLALGIDSAWRRLDRQDRVAQMAVTAHADQWASDAVDSLVYSSIGLEAGVDLVLWRTAPALDELEAAAARTLREGIGPWLTVRHSFLARTGPSRYAPRSTDQTQALQHGDRGRYLIVYPFSKSADWYLLSREARQGIMNEHMRIGHEYTSVRQALGYSFGLDDQDFVVAYETDDMAAFGDLVRDLRATESRRATTKDTPILVGVKREWKEIAELLGAGEISR